MYVCEVELTRGSLELVIVPAAWAGKARLLGDEGGEGFELHGEHHVTLDLELATHKGGLAVKFASHESNKVVVGHGDGAVTLVGFASALLQGASAIFQVNNPRLGVAAFLDVESEDGSYILDNLGALGRELSSEESKHLFGLEGHCVVLKITK